MALTEPGGGSDLQALTTHARRIDDGFVVNGTKTWIANARRSQLIALLQDRPRGAAGAPRHQHLAG
jgi:alkylation response protein AidB-like acyl-CoA dehydrogenase